MLKYCDQIQETLDAIQNNKEALEKYQALMAHINEECRALQEDYGIPKEDVANGLPLGMTASIVDKRNLRSLTEMSHQRMCNRDKTLRETGVRRS